MVKARKAMPKAKQSKEEKNKKLRLSTLITKRKSKDFAKTKRDNTYVFTGFYERLKQIDVKHAHASLNQQSMMFDRLQDGEHGERVETQDDDFSSSNFIVLLQEEKTKTQSPEFSKVFAEIEGLCLSYPLLILNKKRVVQKLLGFLGTERLRVAHLSVLDLCIALVKDLRQDVYEEFLHEMLPAVIAIIDGTDLPLMDKVFQLLSFSFKYLIKPIKANIASVYSVYFELLQHKNRFIRKFTAQSFSYVLRKLNCDQAAISMLVAPLLEEGAANMDDRASGLSELLFEVVSGHGEDLHSKGRSVLSELLMSPSIATNDGCRQVVRVLYLKLVNGIDVGKQLPIFEELTEKLGKADDGGRLELMFRVLNESVKLKYGRRLGHAAVIHITQALNNLATKRSEQARGLPQEAREKFAETLGLLYYFKHSNVLSIFQKSSTDFQTAKSAFTTGVFSMSVEPDCSVAHAFYGLLLQKPDQIDPASDMDVGRILSLKKSNRIVKFSEAGHS